MFNIQSGSSTIGTTLTDIGPFQIIGAGGRLNIQVFNDAGATFNAFEVDLMLPGGSWYTFLSGTDFASTTNSNMKFAGPVTPTTLAAGTTGTAVHMDIGASAIVKFRASVASGTATGRVIMSGGNE